MTRQIAARAPLARIPGNVSEVETIARELRSSFAEMRTRLNDRLQAVERGTMTLEAARGEMRAHAAAVADLQMTLSSLRGGEWRRTPDPGGLAAFRAWITTGDPSELQARGAWRPELSKLPVTTDLERRQGGIPNIAYIILPTFDANLERISALSAPFMDYARVVTIGTDTYSRNIKTKGHAADWADENDPYVNFDALGWGQFTAPARTMRALGKYSARMVIDPTFDLLAEIEEDFGEAFGLITNAACLTGDGLKRPRGFLTHPLQEQVDATEPESGTLGYAKTGSASGFGAAGSEMDVFKRCMALMKPQYLRGCAWFLHRFTLRDILLFKTAGGDSLFEPSTRPGADATILGFPAALFDDFPEGSSGATPVAFANMKRGYTIANRSGVQMLVNPYTEPGQYRIIGWGRRGGGVVVSEAIKLIRWEA